MQNFKVTYNKAPISRQAGKCLVVRAENSVDAIVTAYDHLTQKGNLVGRSFALKPSPDEEKSLHARGVRFEPGQAEGLTLITGVEEYNVKPQGKVIG